jgi:hypothetical protein
MGLISSKTPSPGRWGSRTEANSNRWAGLHLGGAAGRLRRRLHGPMKVLAALGDARPTTTHWDNIAATLAGLNGLLWSFR